MDSWTTQMMFAYLARGEWAVPARLSPPQIDLTEGALTMLTHQPRRSDLRVHVRTMDGQTVECQIHPRRTAIWQDGQRVKLSQLRRGQWAKLYCRMDSGQVVVRDIVIANPTLSQDVSERNAMAEQASPCRPLPGSSAWSGAPIELVAAVAATS